MAFGGETIDNLGVIRWFPVGVDADRAAGQRSGLAAHRGRSAPSGDCRTGWGSPPALTGNRHGGVRLTDFQIRGNQQAPTESWTTRRSAGGQSRRREHVIKTGHLRYRDYFADMRVTIALRLGPCR